MWLVSGTSTQSGNDAEFFSQIKKDYRKVRATAPGKIKSVELVEDKCYSTYAAEKRTS